jgi:hypothetical protein
MNICILVNITANGLHGKLCRILILILIAFFSKIILVRAFFLIIFLAGGMGW